ncbi:MAG: sugar ABC transporter permease [Alphaproteobacteria bacterium]|nr:sugar ABC transporter permease [Alphaproteobacteria bacterium]
MGIVANKRIRKNKFKKSWIIFYVIMAAFPIAQFCVFYLGVNAKSILFAFQRYDYDAGRYLFNGFENFKSVIDNIKLGGSYVTMIENSFAVYFWCLIISVPLALFFSYYIYKKHFGSNLFKILLFMPSILTGIVLVNLFQYMTDFVIPELMLDLFGVEMEPLLGNMETQFGTLIFYTIWTEFGVVVLLYSSAMSGISNSIIEAGEIDGVNSLQEFFLIVLPIIFPTLSMFLLTGVAGIFTNQLSLYALYGDNAESIVWTFGYFLFREARRATLDGYTYLSALGLMSSIVAIILTFSARYLFKKLDPMRD